MHDLAIGRVFRRLRHRLAWRQEDVARRAGVSTSTYSDAERGQFGRMTLKTVRRIAAVLEVDLPLEARWRGGSLDRLLSQRHAEMSELLATTLIAAGWEVRPEVSFSHFGERGVVDLVARHAASQILVLIEIKTELADINALLGVSDRRRRLAAVIARSCGWTASNVSEWLVVAEGRTNRRRVATHGTLLRAAFPRDGRAISGWLRRPVGSMDALWFLPDSNEGGRRRTRAPRLRVRTTNPNVSATPVPARFGDNRNLARSVPPNRA